MSLYKVEYIMDRRLNKSTKKYQYRVKWVGYDENHTTWEPEHNLKFVKDLLQDYERKRTNGRRTLKDLESQHSDEDQSQLIGQSDFSKESQSQPEEESSSEHRPINTRERNKKGKFKRIEKQKRSNPVPLREKKIEKKSQRSSKKDEVFSESSENHKEERQSSESLSQMGPNSSVQAERVIPQIIDIPNEQEQNQQNPHFKVLELARRNSDYLFFVEDSGDKKWITKKELIRTNPYALITFYQKNMQLKPKLKVQDSSSYE